MNYQEMTKAELLQRAKKLISQYHSVVVELYPNLGEDDLKIKLYQAIDRTKMYLATKVCDCTFYDFDLDNYAENRKMLLKILDTLNHTNYNTIRTVWHLELKELFYQQKEQKKTQEELSRLCIIVRNLTKNSFVSLNNGQYDLSQNISQAVEFIPHSSDNSELERIESFISKQFEGDKIKVFFNQKMIGRVTVGV